MRVVINIQQLGIYDEKREHPKLESLYWYIYTVGNGYDLMHKDILHHREVGGRMKSLGTPRLSRINENSRTTNIKVGLCKALVLVAGENVAYIYIFTYITAMVINYTRKSW